MIDLREATVIVLAGGLGTRLRPVLGDRPKVLAQVRGRPFLAYLLDQLEAAHVHAVVLSVGHRAAEVRAAFGSSYGGMRLTYAEEREPLGTAGALRWALPRLASDPVLVLNGDSWCEADLRTLWATHGAREASATLLVTHVADTRRYGRVALDVMGRVTSFCEKGGDPSPGWINAGVYVLSRRLIAAIPPAGAVSLEREVLPSWVGRGLYGHATHGRFLDIGTPESYQAAQA
jgi:NDP-sugar pyrophosphorylase family protein